MVRFGRMQLSRARFWPTCRTPLISEEPKSPECSPHAMTRAMKGVGTIGATNRDTGREDQPSEDRSMCWSSIHSGIKNQM
jgi:hypothetical protein